VNAVTVKEEITPNISCEYLVPHVDLKLQPKKIHLLGCATFKSTVCVCVCVCVHAHAQELNVTRISKFLVVVE